MQNLRRKKLVVPAIVTFAVVFTVFMVYFVAINRAESLLQQLVKGQSNGELIFNVDKVKLDIIHLRFEFRNPELQTRDTISTVTGYNIRAKSISFKAKSFIPFLLGKLIIIDSVLISNPEIEVLKYKETIKKKVSLPEEMSKVYKSLEIVLNVLNLNYLHINSARFKIFDYINPSNKPVEVSRLNLTVNKVTSEKGSGDNRFLFADRILLEVFNQDIVFSDGFHGIKFKRFSLNTLSQTIKLDSCFIYGKQPDSSAGEYRSFVDTVRISKLDLNQWAKNDILKMDSALCINPEVTFLIPLKEKRKRKNAFSDDLINKDSLDFVVKKMLGNLDIGYLTIKNAKVKIVTKRGTESKVYNTSNSNFSIENVFVNSDPKVPIQVGRFNLDVRNYEGYSPDSLYVVRFDNIQILNKKISLLNFRIGPTASNHELLSKEVRMEAFEFNNINWAILLYESRIVAGNVIMVKPELYFKLPGTKKNNTTAADKKNPFRTLEEIRKKVQIDDILIKDGLISIEDLKGTNFSINQLNARLNVNQLLKSTDAFGLMDALDTLTFRNGEYKNPSIQLLINEGSFSKESNSLILSQIIRENNDKSILAKMDNVNLKEIKNKTKNIDGGFPLIDINRLTIDQPEFTSLASNLPENMMIDPGKSNWNLIGLNSDSKTIKADSIQIKLIQPNFRNDKIYMISTGKESVSFTGSDFAFNRGGQDNNDSWSVKMNTIKSSGIRFNTFATDTKGQKIAINSLNLENLILNNRNVSDLHELVNNNDHFRVSDGNIAIENSKTRIEAINLTFDKSSNSLGIDSLSFRPLVDKDEFIKTRQYQSNYMQLNTGLIKVNDIDFNLLINDSIFHSKKITINDLYFYDYKNKRLPFQHGIEKPLLTDLLVRIKPKILIDSILLKNAGIEYEVFNDKTQQIGIVKLSKIRGAITGVKSDDFLPSDSIKFNLFARFMGATDLRASYAQSFTDSLSSFQLKMIASSFNLRTLNPLLKPFASALIKRGHLDTIRMSVVGQKYVAYGIMKMHYHNLKVQYLNKGIEENPSLRSWLISFFANRIVNNKNLDGSGEVYAERDPERGFVNYWVKIFIGGLFTNTGVRTDNKQEKKYNQSIEKYNVPPIPDIPVDF